MVTRCFLGSRAAPPASCGLAVGQAVEKKISFASDFLLLRVVSFAITALGSSRHICQRATGSLRISGAPWRATWLEGRKLSCTSGRHRRSSRAARQSCPHSPREKGARVVIRVPSQVLRGHPGPMELAPPLGFPGFEGTSVFRNASPVRAEGGNGSLGWPARRLGHFRSSTAASQRQRGVRRVAESASASQHASANSPFFGRYGRRLRGASRGFRKEASVSYRSPLGSASVESSSGAE